MNEDERSAAPVEALFTAADLGLPKEVAPALAAGATVHARDTAGLTALMVAAGRGHAGVVSALLSAGADPAAVARGPGATALHMAAQGGHAGIMRLLLEAGASPNQQAPGNGMTPLMSAVWHRHPPVVSLLLQWPGTNPNLRSAFGLTARDLLDAASVRGPRGRETAPPEATDAVTQAMALAFAGRAQETGPGGALFAAVTAGDLATAERLLAEGAAADWRSPASGSFEDGHTPLLVAARDGHEALVDRLLAAGADLAATDTLMQATAVHKAAYNGHAGVLERLAAHRDFARVRDQQGPFNGYTALHDAVWQNHREAARVLLAHGARPTLRGYDGLTPADLAAWHGWDGLPG